MEQSIKFTIVRFNAINFDFKFQEQLKNFTKSADAIITTTATTTTITIATATIDYDD
jgi:hypothetical protein